jgi:hypothetical protein
MAWGNWRKQVPKVTVTGGMFNVKRRVTRQSHVLFRLTQPLSVVRQDTGEELLLAIDTLSDGSSVPGSLWGLLHAKPADLLLPGFAHDYAYRKGAKFKKPGGGTRAIENRYEADLIHIAVSRVMKVRKSDQDKIWYALRFGAKGAYRKRSVGWDGQN